MKNINEIIADVAEPPKTFEGYLMAYADQVGDLVNTYLPTGTHPDMDRYLYTPLKRYSENGGKRHRPLICFAACLAVGAIIGGGTAEEVEALRSYGLDTGLAFQIQDDLLNLIGSEESTKKDFRSDITEGKRTLVVVHALANAAPEARERLIQIRSAKEKDPAVLAEAVDIMQATGSIEYARSYAENLTNVAKGRLVQKVGPSPSRELLISMADWFVNRLK